jgi:hypothetical protein
MTLAPEALSDDDLWRYCHRVAGERSLADRLGCIVLPAALFLAIVFYGWVMFVDRLAFTRTSYHDAELRRRLVKLHLSAADLAEIFETLNLDTQLPWPELVRRADLKNRHAFPTEEESLKEARRLLTQPPEPACLLLWDARVHPRGLRSWARLVIPVAGPGRVAVKTKVHGWFDPRHDPEADLADVEAELPADLCDDLRRLLLAAQPTYFERTPRDHRDGLFVTLTVLWRDPDRRAAASRNLAQLKTEDAKRLDVRVIHLALRAARSATWAAFPWEQRPRPEPAFRKDG